MSLSSLKEIQLDFSWVRALFEDTSREKNIGQSLQLDILPNNSWVLIQTYDSNKIINYCAKKWPNLNFVTFGNNYDTPSKNIYVFDLSLDEFANNSNEHYENFIIKNNVSYRRVLLSNATPASRQTFERIDKQLYKDYGNTIKSLLIIFTSSGDTITHTIPFFKVTMSSFDGKTRVYIFSPISDFNNN
jgi:hypothetical protein